MTQLQADDAEAQGSPIESVDRALRALTALADAGANGLSLAELAGELEMNKATAHRTLAALRFRMFVAQDPSSGRYLLGGAATSLAETFFREDNLPVLLHPALVALSGAADELVHLGVLTGTQIVYLDKVEPERAVRVWSAVGRRNAAVRTALGRALLAFRGTDRAMLEGYVRAADDGSARVPVDADHVWRILQSARANGYATENQENEPDISCVATAIMRGGSAVAAVSITAPVERMSPERIEWLYAQMREVLPPLLPEGLTLP